jgi:molybdate transport system substrate-binding protein
VHLIRPAGVALLALLSWATGAGAQELTLSVAISMKEAMGELGRAFQAGRPGARLQFNVGSSGQLQKQIEAGAPVDLFISAGQAQMDELERARLVKPASRRVFARNVLTVIKPADSRVDMAGPADLAERRVAKIVIGNPKTVPAGQYAAECLKGLGLWERLQAKLVFAENVRQALDYVSRGEVDAGFVYATDVAARAAGVKEAFRPPEDTYRPVLYPAAVVAGTKQGALAQAFIDLLVSREGQAVLARHGFLPPPAGVR